MLRKLVAISCLLCVATMADAGTWTPNNFLYEPNLRVYNTVEENLFITGMVRVDKRLGYEIWVGDPDYGSTLQGALTAIGGNQAALRIPAGTWRIGANLTIPANVTLKPERGAKLTIATGNTLTINGNLEAGLYSIFSCTGTGKVVMGAEIAKVPEWWGATGNGATDDTTALQAWAACGGNLYLPKKTYKTTAAITVPQFAIIDGQGTIYQATQNLEGLIVNDDVTVKNINLTGSMTSFTGPNYHVGIIPYSFRNGSGNNISTGALALFVSGNRMVVDNVKFTAWDVCIWLGKDSIVRNCKAINNWREGFYAGGPGNKVTHNEIDGCDSWAIDFNAGYNEASFNKINNCGRTLADGGGIAFAGLTAEKPMIGLRAFGNSIADCGVGYGIIALSKPTDGVLGNVVIAENTLIGKSTGVSLTAISIYPGSGNTDKMTNINITGNVATNWDTFIQGYYLKGGVIANNIR